MPAAVKDSRSYRCKDNSVIYVDFLADDVSANLRTARDATPVALKAAAPGDPFKSGDYELVGSGPSVTATVPGKDTQSCKRSEERRVGKECVSKCRSRWSPYH